MHYDPIIVLSLEKLKVRAAVSTRLRVKLDEIRHSPTIVQDIYGDEAKHVLFVP